MGNYRHERIAVGVAMRRRKIRTCRWMHACALCPHNIRDGQRYHDGGYGKRAHLCCTMSAVGPSTEERCPGCDRRIVDCGGEAPVAVVLPGPHEPDDPEGPRWWCADCVDDGKAGARG